MEIDRRYRTLMSRQLSKVYKLQHMDRQEYKGKRTLYCTFPLSTSQIVTVLSAPPTATLRPPSSLLQAPLSNVFSKPAGAPPSTRCILFGADENGRTSWMIVWLENDGDNRYVPDGESETEVGVSVCPVKVDICSCFRMSRIWISLSSAEA